MTVRSLKNATCVAFSASAGCMSRWLRGKQHRRAAAAVAHCVHSAEDLAGADALGDAREAPVHEPHQAQPIGRLRPHDRHLRGDNNILELCAG